MLGLILIYFIGKSFHTLATTHGRTPWLFAVLGVLSYYVGAFLLGVVLALSTEMYGTMDTDELGDIVLAFLAIPAGLLSCFTFYKILEHNWSKKVIKPHSEILDDAFVETK